jgi:hypothetical protein
MTVIFVVGGIIIFIATAKCLQRPRSEKRQELVEKVNLEEDELRRIQRVQEQREKRRQREREGKERRISSVPPSDEIGRSSRDRGPYPESGRNHPPHSPRQSPTSGHRHRTDDFDCESSGRRGGPKSYSIGPSAGRKAKVEIHRSFSGNDLRRQG